MSLATIRQQTVRIGEGSLDASDVIYVYGLAFVPIAHWSDPVSAGAPLVCRRTIDTCFLIPYEAIRTSGVKGPISAGRLVAVSISSDPEHGDCMAPTILPGAEIYVDTGVDCQGITDEVYRSYKGGVFLIHHEDGYAIKRVWRTGSTWNCHCDNRMKEPLVVPVDRRRGAAALLAGRVIRITNPLL